MGKSLLNKGSVTNYFTVSIPPTRAASAKCLR